MDKCEGVHSCDYLVPVHQVSSWASGVRAGLLSGWSPRQTTFSTVHTYPQISFALKGAVPPEPAVVKRFSRIPQKPPVTRSNLLSAN